ncbi:MAG: sigma-70 family RNA polymerase sigma factor [Thermosynechococcaceae cyanobacterium]
MQLINFSNIQEQNERVLTAQLLYASDATPEDIRQANRAINQLLNDHQNTIRFFQRQFSGLDPDAAYSAILEAFNCAIRTFQIGIAQFKTWLATKIRFKLLDLCRISQQEFIDIDALLTNGMELFSKPIGIVSDALEQLNAAIFTLPETTQRIIGMYIQGFTWLEVGDVFGKTDNAVRMIFNRAVQTLRKQLITVLIPEMDAQPEIPVIAEPLHWMTQLRLLASRVRLTPQSSDIQTVITARGKVHAISLRPTPANPNPTIYSCPNPNEPPSPGNIGRDHRLAHFVRGVFHGTALWIDNLCTVDPRKILEEHP